MNSYFASVEQQANPRLRGRPVGVAATLSPGGCLIATSKEAKAEGIVTGMSVRDGLQVDPGLRVVEVDPPKYKSTTEAIFRIVAEYSEAIEPYSIDEAFVNLTGTVPTLDAGAAIARILKQRIHDEVGDWLTCSAGVAPTRWLAKFASDTAPKGGLVVLPMDRVETYIAGRGVTEAWGIAHGLERRLQAIGITTLGELKAYPVTNLMEALGVRGYELWANLNGIELGGYGRPSKPKSVGHSHVLRVRNADSRFHRGVLMKLCEKTGRRLRALGLEAHGLWVGAGLLGIDHETDYVSGRARSQRGLTSSRRIYELAWRALESFVRGRIITSLAVTAVDLAPRSGQAELWPAARADGVDSFLDAMNDKYGEYVVQWGTMWGMRKHAPERIGYRKSVDIPNVIIP